MRGVHYTPAAVVRAMVEASLGRWLWRGLVPGADGRDAGALAPRAWRAPAEVEAIRVLDPACGEGAFLLGAFECLLEWHRARARAHGCPAPEGTGHRIAACLHGYDVDAAALARAGAALRARVAAAAAAAAAEAAAAAGSTLRCADALLDPSLPGGFDFVLGNPPYVFGELLGAAEKRAYRRFELGRGGQLDLFKLFFERSFRDFLRPGGTHAFLVPDAVLARDEHADLRAWLARHGTIARLCHVGRVFPRAAVSSLVVVTEKVADTGRPCAVDRWVHDHAEPSHEVALGRPAGGPWSISAPAAWAGPDGLGARLERAGGTLAALLAAGPAGLTRGEERGKGELADCPRPGRPARGSVAIYAGADVRRHRVVPPRRQVARAALAKDAAYYRGPKILLVKTGAGLVAAAADDDLPALQSVYVLHLARPLDPDGVVAVLCSALVTAFAYYTWTSGKGVQPQLTLANVRRLPFPVRAGTPAALAALGDAVRALRGDLGRAGGAGRAAARERAIDESVARLFGLELEDWLPTLRPALDALPGSQRPRWWAGPCRRRRRPPVTVQRAAPGRPRRPRSTRGSSSA